MACVLALRVAAPGRSLELSWIWAEPQARYPAVPFSWRLRLIGAPDLASVVSARSFGGNTRAGIRSAPCTGSGIATVGEVVGSPPGGPGVFVHRAMVRDLLDSGSPVLLRRWRWQKPAGCARSPGCWSDRPGASGRGN